jgi:hypothetical protein
MKPTFFATPTDFRRWLELNHETEQVLLVGFYKRDSGKRRKKLIGPLRRPGPAKASKGSAASSALGPAKRVKREKKVPL